MFLGEISLVSQEKAAYMGRRKTKILEQLEIHGMGAKGRGIGRAADGRVVFVPYTAPGDLLDARVTKKRKSYYEAVPLRFHRLSDWRTEPVCPYFGVCGGCQLQHITYENQLKVKEQTVLDQWQRLGGLEWKEQLPILPSPVVHHYRNKMEYAFTDSRWLTPEEIESGREFDRRGLGFHVPGHWDRILDIDHCYLQAEPGNRIRNALRDWAKAQNLSFYSPRRRQGLLRQLTVRVATTGQIMVIVHFFENDRPAIEKVMQFLGETFPEITSLQYVVNPKANETIYDLPVEVWKGSDHIIEKIGDLRFRIKAKSFFQTNTVQAARLYERVREWAGATAGDTVYDLYSGTGSIALFLAPQAGKVVGIETLPEAVEDARYNARLNGIDNAHFVQGDAKDLFHADLLRQDGRPDMVVVDPPREGLHKSVVEQILRARPRRIVYVSCNAATQARDLDLMKNFYEISRIQPVDMFPQTYHVENIAVLDRKDNA